MGRSNRNENAEAQAEVQGDTSTGEAVEAQAEKRTRKPVDVGVVTIGVSTREIRSTRPSKLDTDPVAVAVRDAELGKRYEIAFEEGKQDAIVSVLRRAGAYYGRGVNIFLVDTDDKVIVFGVSARRIRKAKEENTETSTEDGAEQWAGPTQESPTE